MSEIDPTIISAIIVIVPTIVLVVITFFYMLETKKIRENTQRPSFSLEPTLYTLGGTFHFINLVNSGKSASDIQVHCSWGELTKLENVKDFYIISLGTNFRSRLDIPIAEIVAKKQRLKIDIICKDSASHEYKTTVDANFQNLTTGKELTYQYDPLSSISNHLSDIVRKLK